ncbi:MULTISPECIES: class I SAM-dependent methyltransferase [Alphaproteobacteria]|jgi:SAM-dependent methyltransferase|uniref:class I SAM-dependent methyltransferase n=1 Tax=Alphaproteobacteria TaxID=28211 RepID=UPI0007C33AB9|nr:MULTISPECIES: class I SAM-dependent methyltransferase [Alphaproteobacteria]KZX91688.1 MerR family transcriptional regulator [Sulfitobacter sp. HI0021]KZX99869.1 MerR family transcriptional regulator [Sulfitobacter sp. HI0027]KZY99270.1 MerR family transcriptional regulator [Sulfitobacter sp. HI0076]PHR72140.1 MAG: class I SAM-dependent methyltransferase [Henriciella sp.]|tara:strand:+ start:1286 stop:2017 length:732 start_codon:yes stop_codon:yes gene_type:complete
MPESYDTIGLDYAKLRCADARIAKLIHTALGESRAVLNVGAGAGSYEPVDRMITALEPSAEMIAQRPTSNARVVQGIAENLPFDDDCFDAVMAVLTVHHWNDKAKGMAELRRVSRGPKVILTYDPTFRDFWLFDYFPELAALDKGQMPPIDEYAKWLGEVEVSPVLIPHDCSDGFLAAYWRRPSAYLDARVRAGISSFWKIGDIAPGLESLRRDLESGTWTKQFGDVLELDKRDCGYRLVVAP